VRREQSSINFFFVEKEEILELDVNLVKKSLGANGANAGQEHVWTLRFYFQTLPFLI
jgi:hypothetical protein